MIKLYAFTPLKDYSSLQKTKVDLSPIIKSLVHSFDYNHSEYLQLSRSILRHDLFVNTIDKDFSGKLLTVHPENKIDGKDEIILIENSNLPAIFSVFDLIQKASQQSTSVEPPFIQDIVEFLKMAHAKGFDVVSTSKLSWQYGD